MNPLPVLGVAYSGLADGPANMALDTAQHQATLADGQPRLRFYHCHPTVSIGWHEHPDHAVRAAYCAANGIPVVRRGSGGGALYLDADQMCWTLTARRRDLPADLDTVLERLAVGMLTGLAELGVNARFQPPNDLEVQGRKLGAVFAGEAGDVWIAHGVVLEDVDAEAFLKALRVPKEKLRPEGILLAAERFTTLDALLGRRVGRLLATVLGLGLAEMLDMVLGPRPVVPAAAAPPPLHWGPPAGDGAFTAFLVTGGGVLHAALRLGAAGRRIAGCALHGDVQLRPNNLLSNLCAALVGHPVAELAPRVRQFLQGRDWEMCGFTPRELVRVLEMAAARRDQQARLGLDCAQANSLMVHDPAGPGDVLAILAAVDAVLVPYCAKPVWCKWRHQDGCPECGRCAVGDAYRLARERGLPAITVRNFEHLQDVLARLRGGGARAYAGMCCNDFFVKRHHAFVAAAMPAVLMDITGANCYDLQQEKLAYAGRFAAQAELDRPVLEKVMAAVPGKAVS